MLGRRTTLGLLALLLTAAPAAAVELSVWALRDDIGSSTDCIAYNPATGNLLIVADHVYEWPRGATSGTVLVSDVNWSGQGIACAYVPSRNSYLIAERDTNDIVEVAVGVADQLPTTYVDVDAPNPAFSPAGGMPHRNNYAYYKHQWTGTEYTVHRFTLDGATGTDSEYIPYSAFQVLSSTGPSQQMTMNSAGLLHLSARNSVIKPNKGIYYWDESGAQLVPVIQEPAIKAHTGQGNATIYGMAFDAQDALYFYDIYSASVLRVDRWGNLSTFLTANDLRIFMGDPDLQVHLAWMIVVGNELIFSSGNVSGHILTARLPVIDDYDLVTVPGTDYEVNGPAYPYEIGRFEITNAQYCLFLNDAELTQQTDPGSPRCSHMWFDPANGDVFMDDVSGLPPGSERYDKTLYKTSDLPDSKIKYDILMPPGSRFYVIPDYEHHPVGTVSWFGAAKFCNWLTIESGMDASQVCYHEGLIKDDWYAITAADWNNSGLAIAERLALVRDYRGYRLPMDGVNYDNGGPGVAHSWNIDANPYNEWYKAAAFDPAAPDTVRPGPGDYEEVQPDHWIFGFGADVLTPADANCVASDPPFPETTPVGWYDGVNLLLDATPTNDTRNRYGLYDMCANMAEWITDTALEYPWDSYYRGTRGGRWVNNDEMWVTNSIRVITTARYYAENNIGFRVLRCFGYGDFNGDESSDLGDYAFFTAALTGPVAAIPPGAGHEACDYNGDTHVDLRDFAGLQRALGQP